MKYIDAQTVEYTPEELEMRDVFDAVQSEGLSVARSIERMRDYGYARGWVVESKFVTWLRS